MVSGSQAVKSGRTTSSGKPIYVAARTVRASPSSSRTSAQPTPQNSPQSRSNYVTGGISVRASGAEAPSKALSPAAQARYTELQQKQTVSAPAPTQTKSVSQQPGNVARGQTIVSDQSITAARENLRAAEMYYGTYSVSSKDLGKQVIASGKDEQAKAISQIYLARQQQERISEMQKKYGYSGDSLNELNKTAQAKEWFNWLQTPQNIDIKQSAPFGFSTTIQRTPSQINAANRKIERGVSFSTSRKEEPEVSYASMTPGVGFGKPTTKQFISNVAGGINKGLSNTSQFLQDVKNSSNKFYNKQSQNVNILAAQGKGVSFVNLATGQPRNAPGFNIGKIAQPLANFNIEAQSKSVGGAANIGTGYITAVRTKPISTIGESALLGFGFGSGTAYLETKGAKLFATGAKLRGAALMGTSKAIGIGGGALYGAQVYSTIKSKPTRTEKEFVIGEELASLTFFGIGAKAGESFFAGKARTGYGVVLNEAAKLKEDIKFEATFEYPKTTLFKDARTKIVTPEETFLSSKATMSEFQTLEVPTIKSIIGKSETGKTRLYVDSTGRQVISKDITVRDGKRSKDYLVRQTTRPTDSKSELKIFEINKQGSLKPFYSGKVVSPPILPTQFFEKQNVLKQRDILDVQKDLTIETTKSVNVQTGRTQSGLNVGIVSAETQMLTAATIPGREATRLTGGKPVLEVDAQFRDVPLFDFSRRNKEDALGFAIGEDEIGINLKLINNQREFKGTIYHETTHIADPNILFEKDEALFFTNRKEYNKKVSQALKDFYYTASIKKEEQLIKTGKSTIDVRDFAKYLKKSYAPEKFLIETRANMYDLAYGNENILSKTKTGKEILSFIGGDVKIVAGGKIASTSTPGLKQFSFGRAIYSVGQKQAEFTRENIELTQLPTKYVFVDYTPKNKISRVVSSDTNIEILKRASSKIEQKSKQRLYGVFTYNKDVEIGKMFDVQPLTFSNKNSLGGGTSEFKELPSNNGLSQLSVLKQETVRIKRPKIDFANVDKLKLREPILNKPATMKPILKPVMLQKSFTRQLNNLNTKNNFGAYFKKSQVQSPSLKFNMDTNFINMNQLQQPTVIPQMKQFTGISNIQRQNMNLDIIPQSETIQMTSYKGSPVTTSYADNFNMPIPIKIPTIKFPSFGGGSSGGDSGYKPKKKTKQKKKYNPTLRAASFGLRGRTMRVSVFSGLGERFLR